MTQEYHDSEFDVARRHVVVQDEGNCSSSSLLCTSFGSCLVSPPFRLAAVVSKT